MRRQMDMSICRLQMDMSMYRSKDPQTYIQIDTYTQTLILIGRAVATVSILSVQ